jgi:ligand-binding sensor domain-containing protein
MKVENGQLVAFSGSELYLYSSFSEIEKGSVSNVYDVSSLKDKNIMWLATGESGITGLKRNGPNQYEIITSNLITGGPKRNYTAFLNMHNDKLYIAGGGRWLDRLNIPGTIMVYDSKTQAWNNYQDIAGFSDATSIAVDPKNDNHLYVSTWGEGIYEFENGELIHTHNRNNSPLESASPDRNPEKYIRVEGLCFDKNNHLWMTNSGATNTIKVMKADGTWNSLNYPSISNSHLADKILILNNGDKWVNIVRGNNSGLFVFNDNGTPDNMLDDTHHHFTSLRDASHTIGTNLYFCIVEDKNGDLWIGTDRGPVILYNPSRVLNNPAGIYFTRIVQEGNYFLSDEWVHAIAVDGGNRKWLGTRSSGAFLISEDGKDILEHFTTDNSYLPSNNIQNITIDHKTGELFFGTENGLVSYFGEATTGSEDYSNVYAYPNPVRPDFDEKVIVTGLMENSNVKITDVIGNLIYQTKSVGGQISWNCKNRSGKRVASGVYLVLSATPKAKESVVTKIAVVQ